VSAPFQVDELAQFSRAVFQAVGVAAEDAAVITDVLVHADLRGHGSHGLTRIPIYADRIAKGAVKARPQMHFERTAPSFLFVDGDNGPGPVVAEKGLQAGLDVASETGVCAVAMAHSNHNGAGSYYVEKAIAAGCMAIAMTNAPPSMTVFGGRQSVIGTNPITFGTPIAGDTPVLLDMATSVVARGKIVEAAKRADSIPGGWALDAQGKPTTDGRAAEKGVVLPMAGPKGSALAIMVETLAGVLSGGRFAGTLGNLYSDYETPQDIGHFFLLIDVSRTHVADRHAVRMRQLVEELQACTTAEGFDAILMPGELEQTRAIESMREGIVLPANVVADLNATAAEYSLPALRELTSVSA
jgi:LDH2 family malate/lactate/ureidoglycolate dehydrogenase